MATRRRITKDEQAKAQEALLDPEGYDLRVGDTVYVTHHKPETYLKCFIVRHERKTGKPYIANITWYVARALGLAPKDHDGEWYLRETVYGMDRAFAVVSALSRTLFDDDLALNHKWL